MVVETVGEQSQQMPKTTQEGVEKKPLRILVVEDDAMTLKILEKRLLKGGYEVRTADNGRIAYDIYEDFEPQLVISDWMMPEMDGRELCHQIKSNYAERSTYFILLTAKDKNEDVISALDRGADEYLIKPCDGQELMARIRAAERMLDLQQELSRSNRELHRANERINKEIQAIGTIQRSLLPQSLPEIEGYRFGALYRPSTECSGDFYDLLPLEGNRLGIVIGDVSGHGAPAMVAMALIRMLYRMEAPKTSEPAQFLYDINNLMFAHLPTAQYATMFYGVLDLETGELNYSSAGHPPALLMDQTGGTNSYLTGCEGFPIKLVGEDMEYDAHRLKLERGQCLIFYTDGLPEAFNAEMDAYGQERMQQVVRGLATDQPEALIQAILDDLEQFCDQAPLDDDLSLLCLSRLSD